MVTLGCDPEMRFSDNGYGIDAHDRLPSYTPFGCDGCSETVELRPGTSSNPLELVGKIKNVMEEGIRELIKKSDIYEPKPGFYQLM